MKKQENGFVWLLDVPLREGMYWRKDLRAKDEATALDLISIENGATGLYVNTWRTGSFVRLGHYKKCAQGLFAYCGPDLAPPVK